MEKYISIPIDKIRPDKNQPRKSFDEDALKGMAVSIKNEGVINAIEIDEKFIIITGEQRWRAAKIAGLKEVPVKIIENITEERDNTQYRHFPGSQRNHCGRQEKTETNTVQPDL